MEKYRNKYRIASARAQWWDYGWNGAYFITICTQNRLHYFGRIAIEPRFIVAPNPEDVGGSIAAPPEGDGRSSIAAPNPKDNSQFIAAPFDCDGGSIAAPPEGDDGSIAAPPEGDGGSIAAPPEGDGGSIAAPPEGDGGSSIAASPEGDGGSIAAPPEGDGRSIAAPPEGDGRTSNAAPPKDEPRLIASLPGQWAQQIWHEIPTLFPYAELGDFVVMPDHIHGILILHKPEGLIVKTRFIASQTPDKPRFIASPTTDELRLIASPTTDNPRLIAAPPPESPPPQLGGITGNKNPMLNENVSRIIRWYKGRCSFEIRKTNHDFAWQSRFHDHIIRDDAEYQRISDYIIDNPKKWMERQSHLNLPSRD